MRRFTVAASAFVYLGLAATVAPQSAKSPRIGDRDGEWHLVWADEFERDGQPDPKNWSYDVGGHGWGNQELE